MGSRRLHINFFGDDLQPEGSGSAGSLQPDARTSSIVGGYLSSKNCLIDIGDGFEPSDVAASRALFHDVQPSRMQHRDETLRDHAGR